MGVALIVGRLGVDDEVRVTGRVVELLTRSGVPGAVVDVGGNRVPVWLPISVLVLARRTPGQR